MGCHTPPQKEITVHEKLGEEVREKLGNDELGKKAIRMDHSEIIARNVDCRSCHADVIVGDSVVTRRDCERCHDQPGFFADWKPTLTTAEVTRYHAAHVPQQRAKCLDCHSQIRHQLIPSGELITGNGFLSSAMSDCKHCHTGEHRNVLSLLLGQGAQTLPKSDPNMMFGARTNCYGCHTEHGKVKGEEVMVATQRACVSCHGEEYVDKFTQWKSTLEDSLKETQQTCQKARETLAKATAAPAEARAKAEALLAGAEADLNIVQQGDGVHNITYALQLLDAISARCNEAVAALPETQ